MAQRAQVRTAERRILFFRANVGIEESGAHRAFDPRAALEHLNGLPFTQAGRNWNDAEGNWTTCWVHSTLPRQKLQFARVRSSGLPLLANAGQLTALGIPPHSGLAESIHVVFFDANIVGAEFNFYGPRLSQLARYFCVKATEQCPTLSFDRLLRSNVLGTLKRMREIKSIELHIRSPFAARLAQMNQDPFFKALDAQAKATRAEHVELRLSMGHKRDGHLQAFAKTAVRRILRASEDPRDVSSLVIRGTDPEAGGVGVLDLLGEQLVATKRIIRVDGASKALDAPAAFRAIEDAYAEMKDEIAKAPGVEE